MTTSLTDRYVAATARHVDEAQRAELERELRATIQDMVDGRLDAGAPDRATAEREVLVELGDPLRLAASYSGRPLHLLGPAVYPAWRRLVTLLLATIVPLAAAVTMAARALLGDDQTIGTVVAGGITTALMAAGQVVFWVTLVFVVIERTGAAGTLPDWDPDQLPEPQGARAVTMTDTAATIIVVVVGVLAVVWQQFDSPVRRGGEQVPVLDPSLWSSWIPWILGVWLATAVFGVVLHRTGRWTWRLAAVNALLEAAFAVPVVVLLLSHRLLNDEFVAALVDGGWQDAEQHLALTVAATVVVVTVWGAVDGLVKARRHQAEQPAGC